MSERTPQPTAGFEPIESVAARVVEHLKARAERAAEEAKTK